jgi:hypothetical protein
VVALAGCGGGSDKSTTAQPAGGAQTGSNPQGSQTTTAAGGKSGATTRTGAVPQPGSAPPGSLPKATRTYLATVQGSCATQRKGRAPRLPRKPAGMPAYARAVLPLSMKTLQALSKPGPQRAKAQLAPLLAAYGQLMPYLQELASAPPGPPSEEIKRVAVLVPPTLAGLQAAAASAGVPACGLPIG